MTRTIDIKEADNSFQAVGVLTRAGYEVVVEENGEPLVKIIPLVRPEMKQRVLGLGAEKGYFMSDDFDDELSIGFDLNNR